MSLAILFSSWTLSSLHFLSLSISFFSGTLSSLSLPSWSPLISSGLLSTSNLSWSAHLRPLLTLFLTEFSLQLFLKLLSFLWGHALRLSDFLLHDKSFLIDIEININLWRSWWFLFDRSSQFSHLGFDLLDIFLVLLDFLFRKVFSLLLVLLLELFELFHGLFHLVTAFLHLLDEFGIDVLWSSVFLVMFSFAMLFSLEFLCSFMFLSLTFL